MVDDGTGTRKFVPVATCPGFCGRIALAWTADNITYSDCRVSVPNMFLD